MKRKRKIAVILIGSLLLTGCAAQLEEIIYASKETTESVFAMDTYMTVTAYGAHGKEAVAGTPPTPVRLPIEMPQAFLAFECPKESSHFLFLSHK